MPKATAIQTTVQKIAGMPVALYMFIASVCTLGAKGAERKKTVLRSSKAFKTHCTARKLTKKLATRGLANLARATRPTVNKAPAIKVKGIPESEVHVMIGLNRPKISVKANTMAAEPNKTTRAATLRRISTSSTAPKAIDPRYPALE